MCFVKPTCKDTCTHKIGCDFGGIVWNYIFRLPCSLTNDTFQFKIVHTISACNYMLQICGKRDNNLCEFCCDNCTDDLYHCFVECTFAVDFWRTLFSFWMKVFSISIPIDKMDILFRILNFNDDKIIHCLNFTLLIAKYYIYNCKSQATNLNFTSYCKELKQSLEAKNISCIEMIKDKSSIC